MEGRKMPTKPVKVSRNCDLSERISVQVDPDMKTLATRCSIVWADGTVTRGEVIGPIGEPSNPLTPEKVEEKFLFLAIPVYRAEKAKKIKNLIMHIEEKADLRETFRANSVNRPCKQAVGQWMARFRDYCGSRIFMWEKNL
jgi:2-methylcitrate dehydratase PrpD